jgi:hypothetical protein
MKNLLIATVMLASLLPTIETAHANNPTAKSISTLADFCRAAVRVADNNYADSGFDDSLSTGYCFGYFNGFLEADEVLRSCLPAAVTPEQAVKIFLKWVDKNPEKNHWERPLGVRLAFIETYNCLPART